MAERMLRCHRCHMQLPVEELRLDRDGKSWVCRACIAGKKMTDRVRDLEPFEKQMHQRQEEFVKGQMQSYKCSCGYSFKRSADKPVSRCPYCGRDASAFKKDVSAHDLVQDASDWD